MSSKVGHITDRDLGWNAIMEKLRQGLNGHTAKVGIQSSDGPTVHGSATLGLIASVHEFGSPARKIPQRSYLGSTFDVNRQRYLQAVYKIVRMVTTPRGPGIVRGLTELGEEMRADIIDTMRASVPPKWKKSTRKRKEREGKLGDPTLWDTGMLVGSIRSVVE